MGTGELVTQPDDLVLYLGGGRELLTCAVVELREGVARQADPIPWAVSKWADWTGEVLHSVFDHPYHQRSTWASSTGQTALKCGRCAHMNHPALEPLKSDGFLVRLGVTSNARAIHRALERSEEVDAVRLAMYQGQVDEECCAISPLSFSRGFSRECCSPTI